MEVRARWMALDIAVKALEKTPVYGPEEAHFFGLLAELRLRREAAWDELQRRPENLLSETEIATLARK